MCAKAYGKNQNGFYLISHLNKSSLVLKTLKLDKPDVYFLNSRNNFLPITERLMTELTKLYLSNLKLIDRNR